jgi:hypothetical protein
VNAQQWRQRGFKTIFRRGRVFLYQPSSGAVFYAFVNNGLWMEHDNIGAPPWEGTVIGLPALTTEQEADLIETASICYCDQGVDLCDFCGGIRPPKDGHK